MAVQNTILGRIFKNKSLPGKKEILSSVGNVAKDFIRNPSKAVKDGLARDKLAVNAMKSVTGKTRGQAVRQLGSAIAKGVYKGGGKDLAVNTGGLAGSGAGKLGQLAGDWGGAAVTRKALDDSEALVRAAKITKNNKFKNLNPIKKVELLRRRSTKEAKKTTSGYKKRTKTGYSRLGNW